MDAVIITKKYKQKFINEIQRKQTSKIRQKK